jgi:hypothetical protein
VTDVGCKESLVDMQGVRLEDRDRDHGSLHRGEGDGFAP